jgi:hypothetical protein
MSDRLPRVGVLLIGASFLGYWALLVYCDVWKPASFGLRLRTDGAGLAVEALAAGGAAERAGLRAGDRLVSVDGHRVGGRLDWKAVEANLVFGRPVEIAADRAGAPVRAALTPEPASWASWRLQEGPALAAARAMQLATLLLAVFVAWRRPRDVGALVGAAFLAAVSVFSITLPFRLASVWRTLPAPVSWLLAVPFATNVAVAALAFSFFAVFPRARIRTPLAWAAVWAPMAPGLVGHAREGYYVVGLGRPAPGDWPWVELLVTVGVVYVAASVVLLVQTYRGLTDLNERRRVRVIVVGSLVGLLAGTPVVVSFWALSNRIDTRALTSPLAVLGTFLFLVLPLSFAYAILRHRLFDIRVIVRQGLRYGLARRALAGLVPALFVFAGVDLLAHGGEPAGRVLWSRAWLYALVIGAAVVARARRQEWLDALDRRFFRERYNAQRLLRQVLEDTRRAATLEAVAPLIVSRIEEALHPTAVALLLRDAGGRRYRTVAETPAGGLALAELDSENTLVALAGLIGRPVETSGSDTEWLARKLPAGDTRVLQAAGVGLLVPVRAAGGDVAALLVLGAKRSEEPYSADDEELLMAIAESLAQRLASGGVHAASDLTFEECPTCGLCYGPGASRCRHDSAPLVTVPAPHLLAGRYRLERRLGRGGMGTVYAALDTWLERRVAAKIMREDLTGLPGAAARFQQEARAAAAFSHPNVVTVHDVGMAGAHAFLVMELLEGPTLRDLLRAGPIEPRRARAILRDVSSALDAAHRRQMLHRDVKPENIGLVTTPTGEVAKVLDFGLAKVLEASPGGPLGSQTTAGVVLGTPRYMSPEQLRGEDPAPSWDLWALAVLAFEVLTGQHPFSSSLPGAHAAGPGWTCDPRLASLPPSCGEFFDRALALDRSRRPASAAAFFEEIERALHV